MKRGLLVVFWRTINPLTRPLAGWAPWWVLLETTGNRTGRLRRTPLASGPATDAELLLIAVHGRHCGWVRNIDGRPAVRVKHRGRWRSAVASVEALDPAVARGFNFYARSGPAIVGIDPVLVRLRFS